MTTKISFRTIAPACSSGYGFSKSACDRFSIWQDIYRKGKGAFRHSYTSWSLYDILSEAPEEPVFEGKFRACVKEATRIHMTP